MQKALIACLLGAAQLTVASRDTQSQYVLSPIPERGPLSTAVRPQHGDHSVHEDIVSALQKHADPVDAFISLQDDSVRADAEAALSEPRLLRRMGERKAEWMTEGDKMRLRRDGVKFMDITDHEEFYEEQVDVLSGKPSKLGFENSIPFYFFLV